MSKRVIAGGKVLDGRGTLAENLDIFLSDGPNRIAIGSDSLAPGAGGKPHPRMFGTFPRVLGHYVRELGVLPLETAVYKVTGLPAEIAFDASTVADDLDWRDPVREPKGIAWVMQGGETVVEKTAISTSGVAVALNCGNLQLL